ncbi:MAG TPA: helix-turn-helix domain-containing protein [Flavobacterium sp.]|nr:helix-turn-helix domain-containing protein [Flavobacterium sp.]
MQQFSDAARHALRFVNQTHRSLFLTGKAGTGKTTLLREIIRTTHKNTVVVAPTGIAALNAGGVTIHSMFGLPISAFIPDHSAPHVSDRFRAETRQSLKRHLRMSTPKRAVLSALELLVIDEVSMLRADLLDAVDFALQYTRKNNRPFGGVQVLYIGDLQQLPPVVKEEEWALLGRYYKGRYFFHAKAIERQPPVYIELTEIYRQSDAVFIDILNDLRHNKVTASGMQRLNSHVRPGFEVAQNPGYIVLTTHNAKADTLNAKTLEAIPEPPRTYRAEVTGDFPDKIYPLDETLVLKIGAQVMFVKNDTSPERLYFNGKMGVVRSLSEAEIFVYFADENTTIQVERYEWQNIRYSVDENTKEIVEDVIGTFVQYPLKLALAITVHKSQGLTFDRAALDVSDVFMPGQAYVALSRLRSLDGLVLLSPMRMNGMRTDDDVVDFASQRADHATLEATFEVESRLFIRDFLLDTFQWDALIAALREHVESYRHEGKGEKAKQASWAQQQLNTIAGCGEPTRKFQAQLAHLFSTKEPDIDFVSQRLDAAIAYFQPMVEQVLEAVIWKMEEVARWKKGRQFYQELEELENELTIRILRLFRARDMVAVIRDRRPLEKTTLTENHSGYRDAIRKRVRDAYREANGGNGSDDRPSARKGKKEPAEKKKSTVIQTYELWCEKRSVREIAELRSLTTQTINGHIAKLVEARAIALHEVLPEERIAELAQIFEGYEDPSLGPLKERHGDRFTWDELKLYKAGLIAASQVVD